MRSSLQAGGPVLSSVGKQTSFQVGALHLEAPALTVSDQASQLQCPPTLLVDEAKVIVNPLADLQYFMDNNATSAHTSRIDVCNEIGTDSCVHTLKTSIMKRQCDCGSCIEIRVTGFIVFTCECDVEYITDINEFWSLKDIVNFKMTGSITDAGARMKCGHNVLRHRYIHHRGMCHCSTLNGMHGSKTNTDDVEAKTPSKELSVAYGCNTGCGQIFHYHKVSKETKENVTPAAKAFYEREKKRSGAKETGTFFLCEFFTKDCVRVQNGQIHFHAPIKSKEKWNPVNAIQESLDNTTEEELGKLDGIDEARKEGLIPVKETKLEPLFVPRAVTARMKKSANANTADSSDNNNNKSENKPELSSNTTTKVDAPIVKEEVVVNHMNVQPIQHHVIDVQEYVKRDELLAAIQELKDLYDQEDDEDSCTHSVASIPTIPPVDEPDDRINGFHLGARDPTDRVIIFTSREKFPLKEGFFTAIGTKVRSLLYTTREYHGLFNNANFIEVTEINQVQNQIAGWLASFFIQAEDLRVQQEDLVSALSMAYNGFYDGEIYTELTNFLLLKTMLDVPGPATSKAPYGYFASMVMNKMHELPDEVKTFYAHPNHYDATINTVMHVVNRKVAMNCKTLLSLPMATNYGVPGLMQKPSDFH